MKDTSGEISLKDGYKFLWMAGSGDGEIYGSVQKPEGGFAPGLSGWYRTTDPVVAADIAQRRLNLEKMK